MDLDGILAAAVASVASGKRTPFCFRAHVPGKGYTNDGSSPADRAEYLRQAGEAAQSEVENMGYASGYAEPGYSSAKGVLLANWNRLPRGIDSVLERMGFGVEWSDEWTTCEDCNRAIRTHGDSYSWRPAYIEDENGEEENGSILCLECAAAEDAENEDEDEA